MRQELLHIAVMRIVISYLGEKMQYGWWQSAFWAPTADGFLSPVFPRTIFAAKANGACASAKKLHDERIGIGRVFHLFRLPEDVEQSIHFALQSDLVRQKATPLISSITEAVDFLAANCGSQHVSESVGPVVCGKISELYSSFVMESVARTYLNGFRRESEVFPYLTDSDTEDQK
jgi:hypothetical protein